MLTVKAHLNLFELNLESQSQALSVLPDRKEFSFYNYVHQFPVS